jgi:hypothetical protein
MECGDLSPLKRGRPRRPYVRQGRTLIELQQVAALQSASRGLNELFFVLNRTDYANNKRYRTLRLG